MGFLRALRGDVLTEAELAAARTEGVEVLVERARCTLAYDDYRAPGKRFRGKRVLTSGGLLLTTSRVVVWGGGVRHLDVSRASLTTGSLGSLAVEADPGVLRLTWRAEDFHADRSGQVELGLTTPEAERIAALLGGG